MYYETDTNDHGLRYNPLKACVVPRPIARLGYKDYASVESVFDMEKRTPEDMLSSPAPARTL